MRSTYELAIPSKTRVGCAQRISPAIY